MTVQVKLATQLDQIKRCAPVMRELRASLTDSGSTLADCSASHDIDFVIWLFIEPTILQRVLLVVGSYHLQPWVRELFQVQRSMAYVDDRPG